MCNTPPLWLFLFRSNWTIDCLERIKHLQAEVDADMKKIKQMEKEYAATEERLRKLKKEFGFID